MLVSHDALYRGLRTLLDETLATRPNSDVDRQIALYAEREVETRDVEGD